MFVHHISISGMPRFDKQAVERNNLAWIIIDLYKVAGIEGHKRGHSGKTSVLLRTIYNQIFSDQLIKECTGQHSLEALHKYLLHMQTGVYALLLSVTRALKCRTLGAILQWLFCLPCALYPAVVSARFAR